MMKYTIPEPVIHLPNPKRSRATPRCSVGRGRYSWVAYEVTRRAASAATYPNTSAQTLCVAIPIASATTKLVTDPLIV
jgi:hypothetical protein